MDEAEVQAMIVCRITITRSMSEDGELLDDVEATRPAGDGIGIAEALGMLRLAEHTLLADYAADEDDGE